MYYISYPIPLSSLAACDFLSSSWYFVMVLFKASVLFQCKPNGLSFNYPILSYPILSYPILSYPFLSWPYFLAFMNWTGGVPRTRVESAEQQSSSQTDQSLELNGALGGFWRWKYALLMVMPSGRSLNLYCLLCLWYTLAVCKTIHGSGRKWRAGAVVCLFVRREA